MSGKNRVLVVDDDSEILSMLSTFLENQGFDVERAEDLAQFREVMAQSAIDIIILDKMLPDGSGTDACRDLRVSGNKTPVIMATAVTEEIDRIIALEVGADDYISKPYNPRELVARVKAILRRVKDSQEPVPDAALSVYCFEDFCLDNAARTVTSPTDEKLDLTSAEFDVLRTFMERPNRTITRIEIIESTHNRVSSEPFDRSVDVLISRLRKKLEEAGGRPDLLKTVRNSGYQFTARIQREDSPQ